MTATKKPRVVLTGLEAQARIMIEASREADSGEVKDWTRRQLVRNVFSAMWASALPRHKIEAMAMIMGGLKAEPDLKSTLNSLVRGGLLRSRTSGGVRLYELNFADETV